jgi:hypothetical protein
MLDTDARYFITCDLEPGGVLILPQSPKLQELHSNNEDAVQITETGTKTSNRNTS